MHVLVATADGNVVGTISGSCHAEEGHLRGMAVLPAWHGLGVAAKLLAGIEALLRGYGCKRITLDTTLPLVPASTPLYEDQPHQNREHCRSYLCNDGFRRGVTCPDRGSLQTRRGVF